MSTQSKHLAERVVRLSLLAYFGLALAGLAAASVWLLRAAPPSLLALLVVVLIRTCYGVAAASLAFATRFLVRAIKDRTDTRAYRLRHGLCLPCGYNLTGNLSGTCPECGSPTRATPA
jgi:hypothetical protein